MPQLTCVCGQILDLGEVPSFFSYRFGLTEDYYEADGAETPERFFDALIRYTRGAFVCPNCRRMHISKPRAPRSMITYRPEIGHRELESILKSAPSLQPHECVTDDFVGVERQEILRLTDIAFAFFVDEYPSSPSALLSTRVSEWLEGVARQRGLNQECYLTSLISPDWTRITITSPTWLSELWTEFRRKAIAFTVVIVPVGESRWVAIRMNYYGRCEAIWASPSEPLRHEVVCGVE